MRIAHHVLCALLAAGLAWSAHAGTPSTHKLNPDEEELFTLLRDNPLQQRKSMKLDPILCLVARQRAEDLGARRYFSHTNPDGKGANAVVTAAGYRLPEPYYQANQSNNIESIAAKLPRGTAADGIERWLGSPLHKAHTMATNPFNREQTRIGIGVAHFSSAPFATYYVFLSAPPNRSSKPPRVTLKSSKGRVLSKTWQ